MSWQATTAVTRHSQAKGSEQLLLLCIANYAGADGTGAYPSNKTLCEDSKLSERAVRYIIRRLQELGELTVEERGGPGGSNRYQIHLPIGEPRARSRSK